MPEGAFTPQPHEKVMDAFIEELLTKFSHPENEHMLDVSALRQGDRTSTEVQFSINGNKLAPDMWDDVKTFAREVFTTNNLNEHNLELQFIDVPNQIMIIKKPNN